MDRPTWPASSSPTARRRRPTCSTPSTARCRRACSTARLVAPIARFMGVGDITVRSDLTYERYNTPRPRRLWAAAAHRARHRRAHRVRRHERRTSPGPTLPLLDEAELQTPTSVPNPPKVGDPAGRGRREDHPHRVRPTGRSIMAGDGEGIVDAPAAGLLDRPRAASCTPAAFADDPDALCRSRSTSDAVARPHRHQPPAAPRGGARSGRTTGVHRASPARSRCGTTRTTSGSTSSPTPTTTPSRSPSPEGGGVGRGDRLRQPGHATPPRTNRPTPSTAARTAGHRLAHRRLLERHRREAAHPLRQADHQRPALPPPGPGRRPQPVHHRGRRSASTARTRSPSRSVEDSRLPRGEVLSAARSTPTRRSRSRSPTPIRAACAATTTWPRSASPRSNPKPRRPGLAERRRRHPAAHRTSSRRAGKASERQRPVHPPHPAAHRRHELGARPTRSGAWPASGTSRRRGSSRSAARSACPRPPADNVIDKALGIPDADRRRRDGHLDPAHPRRHQEHRHRPRSTATRRPGGCPASSTSTATA